MRKARFLMTLLLILGASVAVDDHADITIDSQIFDMDFGTWDPASGSASLTSDFCVVSVQGKVKSATTVTPYAAMVGNSKGVPFEFTSKAGVIPMTITHVDLVTMAADVLTPDVYTAQTKTGEFGGCPGGVNARLRSDISVLDLTSAPGGTYRADLDFTAQGGTDGAETSKATKFRADIVIPELVQITDMDPMSLGFFDGINDLIGVDGVCVYRNEAAGDYTIAGTGDGAGSAFEIASGGNVLPYQVEYDDGSGFVALTAGGLPVNQTNADTTASDCGGGTTASLRVTVLATDMLAAPNGSYAGTLTLTVAAI